jgi:signal transduction histidine kinase
MKRLIVLLLLLVAQLSLQAGQSSYPLEMAYFHNEQTSHTLQSVQHQDFKPYQGQLRLGFVVGETWLRIRLQNTPKSSPVSQVNTGSALVLKIKPYSIDKLMFYQQQDGMWMQQLGGEFNLLTRKICLDWGHCFALKPPGINDSDFVYVKVQTSGARIVHTEVMTVEEMYLSSVAEIQNTSTALSLSIALLILSIVFFLMERSQLLFVFGFFQASVVLSICTFSGVLTPWWTWLQHAPYEFLGPLVLLTRVPMMTLLAWVFVLPYKPSAVYTKLVFSLLTLSGVNVVLVLIGQDMLAGIINYGLAFLVPVLNIWAVQTIRSTMAGRWIFMSGWVIFLCLAILGMPYSIGNPDLRDQFALIHSFSDVRLTGVPIGILVFWLVAKEKSKRQLRKLEEIQVLQIQAAESQANQESLEERMKLIDMLTHELKTPLSTIKFALASLKRTAVANVESATRVQHIDASVNRMNAMIEHVAISNKIEQSVVYGAKEMVPALELMNEVIQEYADPERFELDIQDDVIFRAHPYFLSVIIENLVSNAVKYSADRMIEISIRHASKNVTCFRISNRVTKDSHPDEARLFERYYRHPNFQNRPGIGIGLSLVRSTAEKIGATVRYQSTDLCVIFEVEFPR